MIWEIGGRLFEHRVDYTDLLTVVTQIY